jgi:hypothetical protein
MREPRKVITVKQLTDVLFAPDVTVTWDNQFKGYIAKWVTLPGEVWMQRYSGLKVNQNTGKFITPSNLDMVLNSMGNCGLCYQVEGPPDEI